MKSTQAQVASLCKAYLKGIGMACKVSSQAYSGGSSVDVYLTDLRPDQIKDIDKEFSKYEYGHFDGMQDLYEHDNVRKDIPQVKHLFIRNDYSDQMAQKIKNFLSEMWGVENDRQAQQTFSCDYSTAIHRIFSGAILGFWK